MYTNFFDLLGACREYERKAQRQMVDRLVPFLSAVCYRYAGRLYETQDLVQESLVLIFNHINDCGTEERIFLGWCRRIAVNVCLGKLRKKGILAEPLDDHLHQPAAEPAVLGELNAEVIEAVIDSLPPLQRAVFNLHVLDGYPHAEVAEMMQIKETYSRTLLTRARASLQCLINTKEMQCYEYRTV